MTEYSNMKCSECGETIEPTVRSVERAITTTKHADCYYVCPNPDCRCGYSNSRIEGGRRKIYYQKERNIPLEVRDGLDAVLRQALNVKNRGSKLAKFAFETSEDAVTWTVFRFLLMTGRLPLALDFPAGRIDALLLWGVNCPGTIDNDLLRQRLSGILLQRLGESPDRLTEPDVILLAGEWLVFVEVKYLSANDVKPGYKNFRRYLDAADGLFQASVDEVQADGFYELTRNWVLGTLLAEDLGKRFCLVNLTQNRDAKSAKQFSKSLNQDTNRRFSHLVWPQLMGRLAQPLQPWFKKYAAAKGLC